MRTIRLAAAVSLAALASTTPALAVTGTCTIDRLRVEGDFEFLVAKANGIAMPIELDEASGRFSMSRDAFAAAFPPLCHVSADDDAPCVGSPGSPCTGICIEDEPCTSTDAGGLSADCPDGADFQTPGPTSFIAMDPGTVTGTIDAGGNVTLPAFDFRFRSGFESLLSLDVSPTVSTGLVAAERTGSAFVTGGEPLDFTTGQLTIAGVDALAGAPGAPSTLASGVGIRCTLSPIPSPTSLPPAATVAKLVGKAKRTGPLTEDEGRGDSLALKLKLAPGATPLTVDGGHVILRIRPAGAEDDVLVVAIAGSSFVTKGKKRRFAHAEATPMHVVVGRKVGDGNASAALAGKLTLKAGKKTTLLAGKLEGFDLTALTGDVEVTLAVGAQTVRTTATVDAKGKLR